MSMNWKARTSNRLCWRFWLVSFTCKMVIESKGLAHLHRRVHFKYDNTTFSLREEKKKTFVPFINQNQRILCRARVGYTIVHKKHSFWSWTMQKHLKVEWGAQEHLQGQTEAGIVARVVSVCGIGNWELNANESPLKLLDILRDYSSKTSPRAILKWTLYKPKLVNVEGKLDDGVLTMTPTLISDFCVPLDAL